MPTVLRVDGYRFFFYSDERLEPAHVHVEHAGEEGKIWLDPVSVAYQGGLRTSELTRILRIARENQWQLRRAWNDHFGNEP